VQFINGKSFRYTPNTNYSGSDTFTYRANDGKTNSNIASVSITIIAAEVVPGMVQLSWDTNTEPDLAGYKVYMRTQGSQYGSPVILSSPTIVNQRVVFEVQGLDKAEIHYFVVSAYDQSGNESEFSVEVSKAF